MSADLDELFETLRREIDTIPLGGAAEAHHRGRRRGRRHAALTVSAVIVLIVAGTALGLPGRRPAPPARRPAPALQPALPEAGTPIHFGTPPKMAMVTVGGNHVFTAWTRSEDDSLWLAAADAESAHVLWAPRLIGTGDVTRILAVPSAVLVVTTDGQLIAVDPASGATRWTATWAPDDLYMVVTDEMLVRLVTGGNRVEGIDWVTGRSRWSLPGGPVTWRAALGMSSAADEQRVSQSGQAGSFTDSRFVLATANGPTQMRDSVTGALLATGPVLPANAAPVAADRGWFYAYRDGRVLATDLAGDGATHSYALPPGGSYMVVPCGAGRVCALTNPSQGAPLLTVIDVVRQKQVWQMRSPADFTNITSAGGRILTQDATGLVLWAANGRQHYRVKAFGGWLDPGHLLLIDRLTDQVARYSIADGQTTDLGPEPDVDRTNCDSTADRWICPTRTGLTIWNVG